MRFKGPLGPFLATIMAKWTNFAILAQFGPVLLIKSRILVHFPVELIGGSIWEILSSLSHSIGDLGGYNKWALGPFLAKNGLNWLI